MTLNARVKVLKVGVDPRVTVLVRQLHCLDHLHTWIMAGELVKQSDEKGHLGYDTISMPRVHMCTICSGLCLLDSPYSPVR